MRVIITWTNKKKNQTTEARISKEGWKLENSRKKKIRRQRISGREEKDIVGEEENRKKR